MSPISTNPILRALIVVIPGLLLAIWLASKTGQGDLTVTIYYLDCVVIMVVILFFNITFCINYDYISLILPRFIMQLFSSSRSMCVAIRAPDSFCNEF